MAEPVIIDDGGSTRIKQMVPNSDMDGLIGAHSDLANGRFETAAPVNPKCDLTVVHIDKAAVATTLPALALQPSDIIEIVSENAQRTTVVYRITRQLDITVAPEISGGTEPIVDARQGGDKRRYVVTNAGAIKSVTHTRGTAVTPVFTASANTVYTMVHFS